MMTKFSCLPIHLSTCDPSADQLSYPQQYLNPDSPDRSGCHTILYMHRTQILIIAYLYEFPGVSQSLQSATVFCHVQLCLPLDPRFVCLLSSAQLHALSWKQLHVRTPSIPPDRSPLQSLVPKIPPLSRSSGSTHPTLAPFTKKDHLLIQHFTTSPKAVFCILGLVLTNIFHQNSHIRLLYIYAQEPLKIDLNKNTITIQRQEQL